MIWRYLKLRRLGTVKLTTDEAWSETPGVRYLRPQTKTLSWRKEFGEFYAWVGRANGLSIHGVFMALWSNKQNWKSISHIMLETDGIIDWYSVSHPIFMELYDVFTMIYPYNLIIFSWLVVSTSLKHNMSLSAGMMKFPMEFHNTCSKPPTSSRVFAAPWCRTTKRSSPHASWSPVALSLASGIARRDFRSPCEREKDLLFYRNCWFNWSCF